MRRQHRQYAAEVGRAAAYEGPRVRHPIELEGVGLGALRLLNTNALRLGPQLRVEVPDVDGVMQRPMAMAGTPREMPFFGVRPRGAATAAPMAAPIPVGTTSTAV